MERPPAIVPPILVAALRPGMLRLAGREADGTVINWLSAEDVKQIVPEVGPGKEVVCRIYICPSEDAAEVRAQAKMLIAAYLNVQVYAAFQEWIGRGPKLRAMWDLWQAGDRKGALGTISDEVVDEFGRPRIAGRVLGPRPALRGQRGHDSGADAPAFCRRHFSPGGPPARPDAEHGRLKSW